MPENLDEEQKRKVLEALRDYFHERIADLQDISKKMQLHRAEFIKENPEESSEYDDKLIDTNLHIKFLGKEVRFIEGIFNKFVE